MKWIQFNVDSKKLEYHSSPSLKYYDRAKKIIEKRMLFFFHVSLYLVVNTMLFLINYINFKDEWWAWWSLIFWGIGLMGHFCDVFILFDRGTKNPMQDKKYQLRMAFYLHLIIFIITNSVLLFINLKHTCATLWVLYPLFGWGIGLFYHFFFVFVFKGWNIKRWKQTKTIEFMKKHYGIDPFDKKNMY